MLTFKQWLQTKLTPPLIGVGLILLLAQIFFIFLLFRVNKQKQIDIIERFVSISREAMSIHQSNLLDQMAAIALDETNAKVILLCTEKEAVVWSYPITLSNCKIPKQKWTRISEKSIFSNQLYPKVLILFPLLPDKRLLITISLIVLCIILNGFFLLWRIKYIITTDLYLPSQKMHEVNVKFSIQEFRIFYEELHKLRLQEKLQAADAAIGQITAQVAHDIKSPLAALSMLFKDMYDKIPEAERIAIRSSVKRIQDIVNNLSHMKERTKEESIVQTVNSTNRVELLSSLTESVVSEKRTQYRDRQDVLIEEHFDESSYGAFAAIDTVEFKRVISNLINNAVEALDTKGTVTISLAATATENIITITDTGTGIPPERLTKLATRGTTFGKKDGSGLGLAHARETLEKWQGNMSISSTVGVGTKVALTFKRAQSPAWFLPRIVINPRMKVLLLDDDQSIHDIWKARLRDYDLADGDIELLHFTTARSFSAWYDKQRFPKCLLLSDYELIGEPETGLDVIEKYYIGRDSILVTSHCEEEAIQKRCEKLGVRLLPKGLAYLVPIEVHVREAYDAIYIGNNNMQQMHWKLSAQEYNKEVRYYYNVKHFIHEAKTLDRNIPLYIEEEFLEGDVLHDLNKAVTQYGFSNIYMITKNQTKLPTLSWITQMTTTTPPWNKPKCDNFP